MHAYVLQVLSAIPEWYKASPQYRAIVEGLLPEFDKHDKSFARTYNRLSRTIWSHYTAEFDAATSLLLATKEMLAEPLTPAAATAVNIARTTGGMSGLQALMAALFALLMIGLPLAQVRLPPGWQTLLSDEEATVAIALAIVLAVAAAGRRK